MAYAISQVEETGWQPIRKLLHHPVIHRHVLFSCFDGKAGMQRRRRPDDELAAVLPFGQRHGTSSSAASRSAMNSSTACSTPAIASCIVGAHLDSHDNSTQRPTYS